MWLKHFSRLSRFLSANSKLLRPCFRRFSLESIPLAPASRHPVQCATCCEDLKGGEMKRQLSRASLFIGTLLVQAVPALANAPEGGGAPDYSGITGLYYTLIGVVLAYGVYDTFFKKS